MAMKIFDPDRPLIFSHIPKTAATSMRVTFAAWFGSDMVLHYGPNAAPPESPYPPPGARLIYGHFNRA